mmetsp:Transcript_14950/g.41346  ORF Transcript_14950/g.41346 Transcript_14950/m.41346 type:complete len:247 (-) Transcript_14950:314-1054(-)
MVSAKMVSAPSAWQGFAVVEAEPAKGYPAQGAGGRGPAAAPPPWTPDSGAPLPPVVPPQHPDLGSTGCEDAGLEVLKRPVPVIPGSEEDWNVDKCWPGRKCENITCRRFHSDAERRCARYARGCCEQSPPCPDGLHVRVSSVTKVFTVNLESSADAMRRLRWLEVQPLEERAQYVRMVVYGFALVRVQLLQRLLESMPLLHEVMLPDRMPDATLCVFLCDIVEKCAKSNPRLRDVIFRNNKVEFLW